MGKIISINRSWKREDLQEINEIKEVIKVFKARQQKWKSIDNNSMGITIKKYIEILNKHLMHLQNNYIGSY